MTRHESRHEWGQAKAEKRSACKRAETILPTLVLSATAGDHVAVRRATLRLPTAEAGHYMSYAKKRELQTVTR